MRPAPSVILFTVFSGFGFGTLALHGLGLGTGAAGWAAGFGFAILGLVCSTFHLAHPLRAPFAFRQWRTSWLSREAWACLVALAVMVPVALADLAGHSGLLLAGAIGAGLCAVAVFCTSMIYGQLRAVPRWHHWTTPALFLVFALTGGALLADSTMLAVGLCLGLSGLLAAVFLAGDRRLSRSGLTPGHATGLGGAGRVRSLELPRTGPSYITRELIEASRRGRSATLRVAAVGLSGLAPAVALALLPEAFAVLAATGLHLAGALCARWLFFAEAEHVATLYYGGHISEDG
ncbi:dimethyl sulfoxide reductase anchor subunit family protein [Rhodovulum strictum]|uniref:DMSO reductase n=1 Tax=Rhodovulum strictum TaxID=58314 RepID=A0A844B6X3_9RHOB|nr:DmsC/YnfH family molybdoenzyme membrane anchor subunit [Rhodovulum strictum]MRH21400.1 DMSO reductase [Rhodovulum strictum]